MHRRQDRGSYYGVIGLLASIVLGAFAGYMTGLRACRARASMGIAGALLGAFVGFVILLQFLQLPMHVKRLGGAKMPESTIRCIMR